MLRLVAVPAGLLLLGTVAVRAQPQGFRVSGLPRGESLTMRAAPDAAAAPVETVPVGRRLLGFGCTNETPSGHTWCRAKFGRSVGWARRRYLSPD